MILTCISRRFLYSLLLFLLLCGNGCVSVFAQTDASSQPSDSNAASGEEASSPTPVTEFAPEENQAAKPGMYDQGMTISQVSVQGNRLIDEQKIKDAMLTQTGSLYSRQTLQHDLRRIYDMGYFTDKIKATPIATHDGVQLHIEVEENAPVTGINIVGNTAIPASDIQSMFATQTGLPQNVTQLNDTIAKIEKLYADKGYVLARVKSISDDPDGVINLEINEGRLDKVQFIGNRKTRPDIIKRSMLTKTGDVYNEKQLSEDMRRLFASGSFSDVRRVITVSPENPDKYNLTLELDEKRTGAISVGGGVDTGTGFFGSVGYNDPNFLGRQQNVNAGFSVGSGILLRNSLTQASKRNYQFNVGWSTPSLFKTDNALSTNLFGNDMASFNIPLGVERRVGTSITISRPIKRLKHVAASLTLSPESIHLNEAATASQLKDLHINNAERHRELKGGSFLSLSPTLAYDTRDNRFNPTSGWLNTVSLTGAMGMGSSSYGIASLSLRKYIKIRDGITLALNTQGGKALLGTIPDFNMFRLGGTNSIRGFQEGGLGIGGGYAVASAELRTKVPFLDRLNNQMLSKSLSLAFFTDAGTLAQQSNLNKLLDRGSGYGVSIGTGIRFNLPGVGPIRVDYGIPIAGSNKYPLHFSFGVGQKF